MREIDGLPDQVELRSFSGMLRQKVEHPIPTIACGQRFGLILLLNPLKGFTVLLAVHELPRFSVSLCTLPSNRVLNLAAFRNCTPTIVVVSIFCHAFSLLGYI
jgi:hypothetical protein